EKIAPKRIFHHFLNVVDQRVTAAEQTRFRDTGGVSEPEKIGNIRRIIQSRDLYIPKTMKAKMRLKNFVAAPFAYIHILLVSRRSRPRPTINIPLFLHPPRHCCQPIDPSIGPEDLAIPEMDLLPRMTFQSHPDRTGKIPLQINDVYMRRGLA